MKRRQIINFAGIILLVGSVPAHANPVIPDTFGTSGNIQLFTLIALSSLLVEYLIVRRLLHPWVKFRHALPSFLLINFVSFPITTFFGMMFIWLSELFPLAIEPVMYRWYLHMVGVEVPQLQLRIILANLASFTTGAIAYNLIDMWRGM